RDAALLEVGERISHGAPAYASIVGQPFPGEHSALIEQLRIPRRIEPAARFVITNRVGLQLCALAVDEGLAPQKNRLAVAHDDEGVGRVAGDAEAFEF